MDLMEELVGGGSLINNATLFSVYEFRSTGFKVALYK